MEASEVRRFHHATMDPAPRYWDPASPGAVGAAASWRRPVSGARVVGAPRPRPTRSRHDDLGGLGGYGRALRPGLPPLDLPFARLLNGGYEYELFRYARIGERIVCRSRYKDIYQRDGSAGPDGVRRDRGRLRHRRRRAVAARDQHDDPAMTTPHARCRSRTS